MDGIKIDERLIFEKANYSSQDELFRSVSSVLLKEGFVKETFCQSIIEREKRFPTGLSTRNLKFAIPHTEAEYANESAIVPVFLDEPIIFNRMDNPEESIQVNIVFILVLKDGYQHVKVLGNLIRSMQDEQVVKVFKTARSKEEIIEILKKILK